jgi:Polyketide cyclase / dehydrase and lipid transport
MTLIGKLVLLAGLLALAPACTSEIGVARAPSVPTLSASQVAISVETEVHAPPDVVFDYVVREDTPARDLRSYGIVNGVRGGVRLTDGGWDHAGARRIVVLEDGSTLREQIERLERPTHFRYRVDNFSFMLKDLASEGRGYWELVAIPGGTRVKWTYVFTARACATRPALRAAMGAFFEPYMRQGLGSIRTHIEGDGT